MSSASKGPWVKDEYANLVDAQGKDVCVWGAGLSSTSKNANTVANAKLVQHSAEMYELLHEWYSHLRRMTTQDFDRNHERIRTILEDISNWTDPKDIRIDSLLVAMLERKGYVRINSEKEWFMQYPPQRPMSYIPQPNDTPDSFPCYVRTVSIEYSPDSADVCIVEILDEF